VGVTVILVDGHVVTLPDPSGGTFNAAGDFDRLLPFAAALPMLSRIDEYGDVEFSASELASVCDEASSLLTLARDGPERRGVMRLLAQPTTASCPVRHCALSETDRRQRLHPTTTRSLHDRMLLDSIVTESPA
jgi:hypothetical protein